MKRILITGISRGLGLCLAEKLLKDNFSVIGVCRCQPPKLLYLQEKYGNLLKIIFFDLRNPEKIQNELIHDCLPLTENIDGFVNNAAIAYDDLITNVQLTRLYEMYSVNVFSPIIITKHVLRNMLFNQNRGSIVHISSISAHSGYKGLAMYASTKGALEAFSKNIAREWGVKGIRSNCVVVGFMETEMSSTINDEQRKKIYSRTSLRKATDVEHVASTIAYLLSESAGSITGQNIFVDSGTI